MNYMSDGTNEILIFYGTLDGKVALVSIDFSKKPLEPLHKWEIPEKGSRSSVTCLAIAESVAELYVGRSDGNVEVCLKLLYISLIFDLIDRFGPLLKL